MIAALLVLMVIITVEGSALVPCSPKPLERAGFTRKDKNGVYYRAPLGLFAMPQTTPHFCLSTQRTREEWTDLPEKGGTFIRVLP